MRAVLAGLHACAIARQVNAAFSWLAMHGQRLDAGRTTRSAMVTPPCKVDGATWRIASQRRCVRKICVASQTVPACALARRCCVAQERARVGLSPLLSRLTSIARAVQRICSCAQRCNPLPLKTLEDVHNFQPSPLVSLLQNRLRIVQFKRCSSGELFGFFGVFDGHGGAAAANFVKDRLFANLENHAKFPRDMDAALSALSGGRNVCSVA